MTDAQPNPYPVTSTERDGVFGTIALVIALALVLIGIGQQFLAFSAPLIARSVDLNSSGIALMFAVVALITGAIAVVGAVFGLIGIQPSRRRGRLAAAAGLALCGAQIVGVLASLVVPVIVGALA